MMTQMASLTRGSTLSCGPRMPTVQPARCVAAHARKVEVDPLHKRVAAIGAAVLLASPFTGPALARPSDFIQSKPSASPGEPTNVDKFPFNPSVSGQPAREDTSKTANPQSDPQLFSTTKGLGKALDGKESLPSPLDDGPNPDKVGSQGPGLNLNPFK